MKFALVKIPFRERADYAHQDDNMAGYLKMSDGLSLFGWAVDEWMF